MSIELQSGGNVFITPKQGSNNTFYCRTTGTWQEISKEEIQLNVDKNRNCEWLDDLNGTWTISVCKTFDGDKTLCLSKGTWKLIK